MKAKFISLGARMTFLRFYQRSEQFSAPARSTERGATMIEFALIAPLFFFLIFFTIFMGHFYFARTSLSTAISGVRTGFTRGQSGLPHVQVINDFFDNPTVSTLTQIKPLLSSPDQQNDAFKGGGTYEKMLNVAYGSSLGVQYLSRSTLYALVFTNQLMLESIGPMLKFPCRDEPGCLHCAPLSPPSTDPIVSQAANNPEAWRRLKWTGIRCEYWPSGVFLDPVVGLLNVITGGQASASFKVTKERIYSGSN